jgi:hypothetical protein
LLGKALSLADRRSALLTGPALAPPRAVAFALTIVDFFARHGWMGLIVWRLRGGLQGPRLVSDHCSVYCCWKLANDGFDIALVDLFINGGSTTASYDNNNTTYLIDWVVVKQ